MWLTIKHLLLFATIAHFGYGNPKAVSDSATNSKQCIDHIGQRRCRAFKQQYAKSIICETNRFMKKYCFKTCGFCKVSSPPNCGTSMFGCCWNKVTLKLDATGSNCPICRDKLWYVCKRFRKDCRSDKISGRYMRKWCPATCGQCKRQCHDSIGISNNCGRWARKGLCWKKNSLMNVLCRRTCGFC